MTASQKVQLLWETGAMVFTLTNHGGRTIIKKFGSIIAFLLTLCLVKERDRV